MTDQPLYHYELCVFIRAFEHEIAAMSDAGEVPGLVHLSTGAEVADVSLAGVLDPATDKVTGSHRSHGIALAMGADPEKVAREILGRAGGLSDGLAGTQHLIAPESGFLASNGIVGAQVPLAAGAALTAKTQQTGGVGVAVFGDGAMNQGAVLETMNLAVALGLPMVFALYNNGMAQSTPTRTTDTSAGFSARAASFGLATFEASGHDYRACVSAMNRAVSCAREGRPAFVEVSVTRDDGHYHGDLRGDTAIDKGGLAAFRADLLAGGTRAPALEQAEQRAGARAHEVVNAAKNAACAGAPEFKNWLHLADTNHA